jgi:cell division septum initiation protein DivIVA
VRREAEVHSQTLLTNARNNADEIVSDAREHAEAIISEAVSDAERERTMAAREVDELNRQRESITTYLDDLRGLLTADPVGNLARASRLQAEHEAAGQPEA